MFGGFYVLRYVFFEVICFVFRYVHCGVYMFAMPLGCMLRGLYVLRFVCLEVYMWTSLNRFSGYQSGLARRGFDKKLPTFLDVSVKLFTILIPEAPPTKILPVFF